MAGASDYATEERPGLPACSAVFDQLVCVYPAPKKREMWIVWTAAVADFVNYSLILLRKVHSAC